MRVTIVLAILTFSFVLLGPCNIAFAQDSTNSALQLTDVATDPGAVEVGESLIYPGSPLYFLKAIREKIETALDGSQEAKAMRQIEFAQRRLRETKALLKHKNQDLIDSTLEKYRNHLKTAQDIATNNQDLQVKVAEATSRHIDVLTRVYDQVGNPRAKQAIRAAIERSEEQQRLLLQRLDLARQQKLIRATALRQAHACRFMAREATASGLTDTERAFLKDRVTECLKNVRENLRDELQEIRQRRQ